MANYIKLTKQEILEKDFEVEYKGYKVEDVDAFLDMISEDYKLFAENEAKKDRKIQELEIAYNQLQEEHTNVLAALKLTKQQQEELAKQGLSSSALVKRISMLEKANSEKD
ncbi:hypothetical protein SCHIN_v1c04240 [Spiroplasma chinense]|uniref:DivIVA domain-containing protein n=1 Tax=Spiroplasma chinense TaxID=216932 RepID=A0A5B9Y3M9_9MOLU|nr:DivIVA domain-containing protein [Spiroplasma chinense]QEH61621.1 hypothetical protein SCHIN_v1c04240 [Spiroplasma chinense]